MYTYEEFKEQLLLEAKERYGERCTGMHKSGKTNTYREGLCVESNNSLHAIVYVDDLYIIYQEECFDMVFQIIDGAIENNTSVDVKGKILNWEYIKDYVGFGLINHELNRDIIEEQGVIAWQILDLICYCHILLPTSEFFEDKRGVVNIRITESMLLMWNISKEELIEQCKANEQYDVSSMSLVKANIKTGEQVQEITSPLYAVSNKYWNKGAAGMFHKKTLKAFADKMESDIYILPSSTEEVLFITVDEAPDITTLKETVMSVNEEMVSKEEYLSDSVYFYNRETEEVTIAA